MALEKMFRKVSYRVPALSQRLAADDEGQLITSQEVIELGIQAETIPKPVQCKFCGKELYYEACVLWGEDFTDSEVLWWCYEPQDCTCQEYLDDAAINAEERKKDQKRLKHQQVVNELKSMCGIKNRFWTRTFENFKADTPGRKTAYSAAIDYAHNFADKLANGDGLYIEGTNGTGKTHLATAIGLWLISQEYSVICKTSFDLLNDIKKAYDDASISEHEILRRYQTCDLLIIDDLGKEQCTEWSMSILYSIVNERYEAMKPIIITTNFGAEQLINKLTPRGGDSQTAAAIVSRLREMSRTVTMAWEDFRGK